MQLFSGFRDNCSCAARSLPMSPSHSSTVNNLVFKDPCMLCSSCLDAMTTALLCRARCALPMSPLHTSAVNNCILEDLCMMCSSSLGTVMTVPRFCARCVQPVLPPARFTTTILGLLVPGPELYMVTTALMLALHGMQRTPLASSLSEAHR